MRSRRVITIASLFAALAFAGGCKDEKTADRAKGQGKSYTVRGVIDVEPKPDATEIYIHHEAIHDFVNAFGDTATMKPMKMGFGVAGVKLDGIGKGDKVKVTFHTDWEAKPALQVDAIEKLPADTELDFDRSAGHDDQ
jgi:Cu/Ag efflux protein CusF